MNIENYEADRKYAVILSIYFKFFADFSQNISANFFISELSIDYILEISLQLDFRNFP